MQEFDWEGMIPVLVGATVGLAVGLAIAIGICLLLSNALASIPQQFRQIEPGMVWLLLIPCFSVIWNFFVYPKVARSFRACLEAGGDQSQGDCGEALSWWYSGVAVAGAVLGLIPCVGLLFALAPFVLMIVLLVKFNGLKERVRALPQQPPAL